MSFEIDGNFQTLPVVADHMASMVIGNTGRPTIILEPTPGLGTLVKALEKQGYTVYHPTGDFWISQRRFLGPDYFVMNPPFNPVSSMEKFIYHAMENSHNIIALLPWTYLINSDRRIKELQEYGLVSVTSLPRKAFPGCRVQTAIFELKKGYAGKTELKRFTW